MNRILQIITLVLLLGPTAAHAARYGSLREVDAISCTVNANPVAEALGLNPHTVTKFVSSRLTAEGVAVSRKSPYRLEVLLDGLTMGGIPADTHFVVLRMVLVRDRSEGALVVWEDITYGGWTGRDPVEVNEDVVHWLDTMCRDFVLDYYRDAAVDRSVPTP